MKHNRYDGMIITGAPVETMDFEQVDYWPELCEIMDFSETNVYSTLHVCWGAQAGLYYHYGIRKELLPAKMFGVFEHRVIRPSNPLVRGFDEVFYAPHSRHTAMSREDIDHCSALRILAESDEAGPFLMSTENGRQIFVIGHPEYDKYTLDAEYKRDVAKGLPIAVPKNYYPNDDPSQPPLFRWRAHAHLLYENWLNYYVYQNTPYDLGEMQRVKHSEDEPAQPPAAAPPWESQVYARLFFCLSYQEGRYWKARTERYLWESIRMNGASGWGICPWGAQ